jgi:hypothetical protein
VNAIAGADADGGCDDDNASMDDNDDNGGAG